MCEREARHTEYVFYDQFINNDNVYKNKLFKYFTPSYTTNADSSNTVALRELDYSKLQPFLVNMSKLTGLLLISSENAVKWPGTGFILKLRRQGKEQCPCPLKEQHGNEEVMEHAIVTISTAYHMFNNEVNKKPIKRFDEVNEIWEQCKTKFILDYNDEDKTREKLRVDTSIKTLYGHKLIEMDKDLDFDCDWCAIECVTHDLKLIDSLENTILDYQKGLAELYKISQDPIYKDINLVVIIGHPHNSSKKISIGQTRKFRTAPQKEIMKELRSRQTWCRYSYDNITCEGSSGSPIFKWGQPLTGFGYWFGHPHNHSEGCAEYISERELIYFGKSTIGVERV